MELHRGYAESFPEADPPEPQTATEGAPPGSRPPTAVGYSEGGDPEHRHWFRFGRKRRHSASTRGVAVISEFQRVVWPSHQEVLYLTIVVIVLTLMVGAVLGAIEIGFGWLIDRALLH
jgi:preprotein translocase SecE subunit